MTGPIAFAGFGISAPPLGYDDYGGDVKGKVVLTLDHEPGERDPNSPFDGVVTSEWSTAWRKALAAQEKGAVAVLFVADVHNHPGVANFEAAARNYWPDTAAADSQLHAGRVGGSHSHPGGADFTRDRGDACSPEAARHSTIWPNPQRPHAASHPSRFRANA